MTALYSDWQMLYGIGAYCYQLVDNNEQPLH
jgi:hypothetical protein